MSCCRQTYTPGNCQRTGQVAGPASQGRGAAGGRDHGATAGAPLQQWRRRRRQRDAAGRLPLPGAHRVYIIPPKRVQQHVACAAAATAAAAAAADMKRSNNYSGFTMRYPGASTVFRGQLPAFRSTLPRIQGAVMFLLEGPCGRILHTGDFRCCPNSASSKCTFLNAQSTVPMACKHAAVPCPPSTMLQSRQPAAGRRSKPESQKAIGCMDPQVGAGGAGGATMAPRAHVCAGGPAAAGQHVLPPQVDNTYSHPTYCHPTLFQETQAVHCLPGAGGNSEA